MCRTSAHCQHTAPGPHINSDKGITHVADAVTHRVLVARAEATVCTESPAHDRVIVTQRTGVIRTRAHRPGTTVRTEVDAHERIAHLPCVVTAHDGVAGTELSVGVLAPAHDGVVVEQCTRVRRAGSDCASLRTGRQRDGNERRPHLRGVGATIRRIADTELSTAVGTETQHRAVVTQDARVVRAGRHLRDRGCSTERNVDGDEVVPHLICRTADARHRTGADLPRRVRSEAHERRVVAHHARVRIAQVDVPRKRRTACCRAVATPYGGTSGIGRRIARRHRTRGNECSNDGESHRHTHAVRVMDVGVREVVRRRVHGERT